MRNSAKKALVVASVVCLLSAGSAALAALVEDVVAKVNGKPLLLSEYNKNLKEILTNYQRTLPQILRDEEMVKKIRQKILDQMIDWELLYQRAEAKKVRVHNREIEKGIEEVKERSFRLDELTGRRRTDKDMETAFKDALSKEGLSVSDYRTRIRRQLMIRRIVEVEVRAKLKEPAEKRVKKAFDTLKYIVRHDTSVVKVMGEEEGQGYLLFGEQLRNAHAERVRVSHILVKVPPGSAMMVKSKALQRAKALKGKLDGGADFFEVASKESDDMESAQRGGDLGFILRRWMPPAFEKVAFSLPVGDVSDPVESDFGYHLIRVREKKAREPMNFDKLRLQVVNFLMNVDYEKGMLKLVKSLRDKATVEVLLPADK